LVAIAGLRWFDTGTGGMKPPWLHLSLDRTAFIYLAAVSIGTGILFGLAPALRLARVDVHSAIKDGGQGVAGSRRVLSLSNLLVVAEMALCLVLLAGAGLMIRSTVKLYDAPTGVTASNVLTMRINLPEANYAQSEKQVAFHRTLKTRLDSLPGVEAAAIVSNLPRGRSVPFSYELEREVPDPNRIPEIGAIIATPAYFQVMRVNPRRGRAFADSDSTAGAGVVMVNERFAQIHWPNDDAVGKRIRLLKARIAQPWLTVVGVLPNIPQGRPLEEDPLIYLPFAEEPQREMFIVAKTHVPPGALVDAFRRTVQNMDANLPVYEARTLESWLAQNRLSTELLGGMFSVFAAIALLLASVGLYGVISHSISQRTQEIGVRMAMGGSSRDILRLVYAQGMRPLAIGIAIGLPLALGVTRVLRLALIGVSPNDPTTFLLVVLVLVLAGALGCAIPARRAIRVDPIVALRYE
jgi:putative ABC transport system permease protein